MNEYITHCNNINNNNRSRQSLSAFTFQKGSNYHSGGIEARNNEKYGRFSRAKVGVTDGFKSLVQGIESGLEGLVTQPLAGAERDGIYGFFTGFAKYVFFKKKKTANQLDIALE